MSDGALPSRPPGFSLPRTDPWPRRALSLVDQASSKFWTPSTLASGIFSREANNSFSQANMVYLRYCSSDAWMGNAVSWDEYFYGAPTVRTHAAPIRAVACLTNAISCRSTPCLMTS